MEKDYLEFEGTIIEVLSYGKFRVRVAGTEDLILSHLSGKMRQNNISVVLGDKVKLEVSPYDTSKGRIVKRLR